MSSKVTRLPWRSGAGYFARSSGRREVSLQVREHEEGEKEKDGEVQVEVKGEVEENQGETLIMDGMQMTVKDSRTT